MPKKTELSDIDINASRYVTSMTLTPEERVYLATASRNNAISEAQLLRAGLNFMRTLGEIGFSDTVVVSPIRQDDRRTIILLGLDPADALFTIQEFEQVIADPEDTEDCT